MEIFKSWVLSFLLWSYWALEKVSIKWRHPNLLMLGFSPSMFCPFDRSSHISLCWLWWAGFNWLLYTHRHALYNTNFLNQITSYQNYIIVILSKLKYIRHYALSSEVPLETSEGAPRGTCTLGWESLVWTKFSAILLIRLNKLISGRMTCSVKWHFWLNDPFCQTVISSKRHFWQMTFTAVCLLRQYVVLG